MYTHSNFNSSMFKLVHVFLVAVMATIDPATDAAKVGDLVKFDFDNANQQVYLCETKFSKSRRTKKSRVPVTNGSEGVVTKVDKCGCSVEIDDLQKKVTVIYVSQCDLVVLETGSSPPTPEVAKKRRPFLLAKWFQRPELKRETSNTSTCSDSTVDSESSSTNINAGVEDHQFTLLPRAKNFASTESKYRGADLHRLRCVWNEDSVQRYLQRTAISDRSGLFVVPSDAKKLIENYLDQTIQVSGERRKLVTRAPVAADKKIGFHHLNKDLTILDVVEGSWADKYTNMKDFINWRLVGMNGSRVWNEESFYNVYESVMVPGKEIELYVERDSKYKHSEATLAAKDGNVGVLKELNAKGVSLSENDGFGYLPMTIAGRYGHINVVKYLHEQEISLTAIDKTPLQMSLITTAADFGQIDLIKYLAENTNLNFNKPDKVLNRTALSAAAAKNNLELVKFLESICPNVDFSYSTAHPEHRSVLTCVSHHGWTDVAKYMIEESPNKDTADILKCDGSGRTALTSAAQTGKLELLKYYASIAEEKGFDMNHRDNIGETALDVAVRFHYDQASIEFLRQFQKT